MSPPNFVTHKNLPEFKKLYVEAIRRDEKVFVFHGQDILVAYAKYVIEYFEGAKK